MTMTPTFLRWLTAAVLAVTLAGGARAAAPVELEGFHFPGDLRLADASLELNGTGLRQVAWFKGYAAALYLTRRASTAAQVVAVPGPKRLKICMLVDVDIEEFVKAFDKGVARNAPPSMLPALEERRQRFDAQLRALHKVLKRDVIDLDFVPGQGLKMAVNGKPHGEAIPGEDFYGALLLVFVGEKPPDTRLRAGLLGASSP
jgi:hypothetical protein